MKSTEELSKRLKRVDMHDYFLNRIALAMKNENYIEASWLIYSCLENRYFRTVMKYREHCKYCRSKSKCNKTTKNELALKTKISCVERLYQAGVPCIADAYESSIFKKTKDWIDERNDLMHDLLSLEYYENTDERFKKSAEEGKILLDKTYTYCTEFRKLFYSDGYQFVMPDEAAEKCPCKSKERNK